MTEQEIQHIARTAASAVVREMLPLLGLDASNPKSIQQLQRDFAFLRDLRIGTEAVKRRTLLMVAGAVVTAILAWVALGLRAH